MRNEKPNPRTPPPIQDPILIGTIYKSGETKDTIMQTWIKEAIKEGINGGYSEIDAGMISAPENIMIDNDKIPRDSIAFVQYILIDAFNLVHSDRNWIDSGD